MHEQICSECCAELHKAHPIQRIPRVGQAKGHVHSNGYCSSREVAQSLSCELGMPLSSHSGQDSFYQVFWSLQSDRLKKEKPVQEILLNVASTLPLHLLGLLAHVVVIKH